MQVTYEQTQAWIDRQTENLINGNSVVIGRDVVVDLKDFWIEVENGLIDVDSSDHEFRFLQCRLKGEISEAQHQIDLEIITPIAERMLAPFAERGAREELQDQLDDYQIAEAV